MLSLIAKRASDFKRTGEDMSSPMTFHIPLTTAYLCQDCNCVSNCSRQCPACASEVLLGLAGVLNREVPDPIPQTSYSYRPALVA